MVGLGLKRDSDMFQLERFRISRVLVTYCKKNNRVLEGIIRRHQAANLGFFSTGPDGNFPE